MAIASVGGADATDTGGPVRATAGGVESLGTMQSAQANEGTQSDAGTDTQEATVGGAAGNDSLGSAEGNDTIVSGDGNDTLAGAEGNDSLPEGARTDDEIRESLKAAGGIFADPRYEAGAIEFERTGDVTPETRAKLATEFGVDPSAVDAFIEGQKAQRALLANDATATFDAAVADVTSVIGDKAAYGKFMEWSEEALTDAEKAAYNEALDHAPAAAKVMLAGFNEKYKAAGNGGPRDLTEEAEGGALKGAVGYASSAEMQADMASQKYANDPAFRASVAAKVAVSKF